MNLLLSEEQKLIQKTIHGIAKEHVEPSQLRVYRDGKDARGYSTAFWKKMSEEGWVGLMVPESEGGLGLGLTEMTLCLEAIGARLSPEPFLSTALLAVDTFERDQNKERSSQWLKRLATGDAVVSWAHDERRSRYERRPKDVRLEKKGDQLVLNGEKVNVIDGHIADGYFVSVKDSSHEDAHFSIVFIDASTEGLTRQRQWRMDGRNAATVAFQDVLVSEGDFVSPKQGGGPILEAVFDRATIGHCSEMLGGMNEAFQMTMDYLRTRMQFGSPIGSFQALQHRSARMFQSIAIARVSILAAAKEADRTDSKTSEMASMAKVLTGDAYMQIANEAIQMHGGIGMTDEHSVGWYLKRARADQSLFGDPSWHRNRWASLRGY